MQTVPTDWAMVADAKRTVFLATLRDLDLAALQRYPLPKRGGFPIGHGVRVLVCHTRHRTIHESVYEPARPSGDDTEDLSERTMNAKAWKSNVTGIGALGDLLSWFGLDAV